MNISILSYSFRGLLGQGQMDVFGYLEACKYRVEHHTGENEYSEVAIQLARVRDALDRLRTAS